MSKNKFDLGAFDEIAKVNKEINKEESKAGDNLNKKPNKIVNNNVVSDNVTQEIDLSHLNLKNRNKDLKVQKSLSLKKSTIDRLEKLAKKFETSTSDVADKALREILKLENK